MEIPRSPVRISCQVDTAIMRLAAWPDNTGQATLFRNTVLGTNFCVAGSYATAGRRGAGRLGGGAAGVCMGFVQVGVPRPAGPVGCAGGGDLLPRQR